MRVKKTNIEDPKKVKVGNPNPHSTFCNPEPKPSFVLDTSHPQSQPLHSPYVCFSPEEPSQDVEKSHLSDSMSTTTNLNETSSLDTSCDHLLHLDSPGLSSELQSTSSVESVEPEPVSDFEDLLQLDSTSVSSQDTSSFDIEFVSDPEEPLESSKSSPTDVLSKQHDYDLSQINQEIDTPSDNLHHQDTHACEKQDQDDLLIHATDLSHNFAFPQFMAQHKCEDLNSIDAPSTSSTFTQASSNHTSNHICAHNSMVTQCNQSQYLTLLKQICAQSPSASQVSQANLSNSLTSQYPTDPGEHVLMNLLQK